MIYSLIFAIGLVWLLKFLLALVWEVVKEIIPGNGRLEKYGVKEGKWAVVTGGTDGVGLGFCEVLCKLGWNMCIISRNEQKIKKTIAKISQDLLKTNKKIPQFKYIVADFKNCGNKQFFDKIASELFECRIGILVNNVGTADIKNYENYSLQEIIDLINVNCVSMAGMTSILLPKLKQGRSAIINLSSFLGENCAPYSTLYSATKAFNTFFSESLSMEGELKNIDILSVRPMFVVSPLSRKTKSFTIPDRQECARACLRQLQWQYETNGYFIHRILALFARIFPKFITRSIAKISAKKQLEIYYKHIS